MVTKPFFNQFNYTLEQDLLHSLNVEAIQIYGQDMFYLPRRSGSYDGIYGEDDVEYFDKYYQIEMYIKSFEGFQGQGSFLSQYGLEIRDRVVFSIAVRAFENDITSEEPALIRPREGDLIYFPLNKKCFEIKFVKKLDQFYPLGAVIIYDLDCELFEYSSEKMNTGIPEIDDLEADYSVNIIDFAIATGDNYALATGEGDVLVYSESIYEVNIANNDPLADNIRIETESDRDGANSLINWDESNPFNEPEDGRY